MPTCARVGRKERQPQRPCRARRASLVATLAAVAIGFGAGWRAAWSSDGATAASVARGAVNATDSPVAASSAAAGFSSGGARPALLATGPAESGPRSADALRAALRQIGGRPGSAARQDDYLRLLRAWAALDPEAALAYARAELSSPDRRGQAVALLLADWAGRAPAEAWGWAREQVLDDMQPLDAMLTQIARADTPTAWAIANELGALRPESARAGYECVLRGIMHGGRYEEAAALMGQARLPPDSAGHGGHYLLADTIASEWGRYRPEAAAAWASALPVDSIGRERALINLGGAWAETDPAGASAFAARLSVGGERERMLAATVPNWVEQAPLDAAEWLVGFAGEPEFDFVMARTAASPSIQDHPTAALELAAAISAPEYRLQMLTEIAKSWRERDRAAADAYLAEAGVLPPETRLELLRRLTPRP